MASIIIVLNITDCITAEPALVYFGIAILLVYIKLLSILLHIKDPFESFENLCCAIFFGGISDCLATVLKSFQIKKSECKYD